MKHFPMIRKSKFRQKMGPPLTAISLAHSGNVEQLKIWHPVTRFLGQNREKSKDPTIFDPSWVDLATFREGLIF